jgi:multidrug efflux pump subunit AcrA (membrane-fusion protein)
VAEYPKITIAFVLTIAGLGWKLKKRKPAQLDRIGVVQKGDLAQRVTIAGKVISRRTTVVTPPYSGYVRKIYVKMGETVKAGAPLVTITQSLGDTAESAYPLRSPFAGTVVGVLKTEGEYVEMNRTDNAILRVDDTSELWAHGDVPEIDVPKVKKGQEVIIRPAPLPGKVYPGLIEEVALASKLPPNPGGYNPNDRVEYPIKIRITKKDEALLPGMSVTVDVISEKREGVLYIGHEYVEKKGDGFQAKLITGEVKPIELGIQTIDAFEIKSGLKEGDQLKPVDFFKDTK